MKRFAELDFLKFALAVLVIFGHADVYLLAGCEYAKGASQAYRMLQRLVYEFHMPCFFIISGMLFALKKDSYGDLPNVIKNKAKRLLIPMLAVGGLFDIPIRAASGLYPYGIAQFYENLLIGNTYLWFLEALFFIFIITSLLLKHVKSGLARLCIVLLLYAASAAIKIETPNALSRILTFTIYFYVGLNIMPFKGRIDACILKRFWVAPVLYLIFFAAAALQTFIPPVLDGFFKGLFNIVPALAGSICAYATVLNLFKYKILSEQTAETLSKNSFGMYLYGAPIRIPVLTASVALFGSQFMKSDLWLAVLICAAFVLPCAISYALTVLLRKLKVKYII